MPEFSVQLHPAAAEEAEAARAWYEERNPIAAQAFGIELSSAIERVRETPNR